MYHKGCFLGFFPHSQICYLITLLNTWICQSHLVINFIIIINLYFVVVSDDDDKQHRIYIYNAQYKLMKHILEQVIE